MVCPHCGGKERDGVCQSCQRLLYVGGPRQEHHAGLGRYLIVAASVALLGAGLTLIARPVVSSLLTRNPGPSPCTNQPANEAGPTVSPAALPPIPSRAAAGEVLFSGTVTSADSSKGIPGADVFLNGEGFRTDAEGRWWRQVPAAPVIDAWIVAPGYAAYHGRTAVPAAASGVRVNPIATALRSIFTARDDFAADANHVAPSISTFSAAGAVTFRQVLPAGTSALTVCGASGLRDGKPAISNEAWLAKPDDFVLRVPVALAGGRFQTTLPLNQPGRYVVEINDRSGSAVLNVPIFVGIPYAFAEPPTFPDDLTPDASTQLGFQALNDIRTAHGLAALAADPRLAHIARDHIADWGGRPNANCPHCWSDGSQLASHAQTAGINVAKKSLPLTLSDIFSQRFSYDIGEGITQGVAGGAASIQSLFDSPAHRADMLGDYTHAGIADSGPGPDRSFVIEYAKEG